MTHIPQWIFDHMNLMIVDDDGCDVAKVNIHPGGEYDTIDRGEILGASLDYKRAGDEALAALYGAKECLGDIANISHAIGLLEAAKVRSGRMPA